MSLGPAHRPLCGPPDKGPSITTDDFAAHLHRLHFDTAGLDAFLDQVAVLAADAIRPDAGCGITLIRDSHPATVASSDARTINLDEIQYHTGEGPCLHAARSGEVVVIEELSTDERWPEYRDNALDLGLRSSLSLPLDLGSEATGALNLYLFGNDRVDEAVRSRINQFSGEASRAVSFAMRHEELTRENDHLHAAMASRRIIDQALGILMAQNRCSSHEAFGILRRASQNRNVKIRDLAASIIRSASGSDPDEDTHWRQ